MAGTLVIDTLTDGSGNTTSATAAIRGSAKAWVTFAGATGVISAQHNVSSVTRTGTGLYTITFASAMADTNYSICGFSRNSANTARIVVCASSQSTTFSTTQIAITVGDYANNVDSTAVSLTVFR